MKTILCKRAAEPIAIDGVLNDAAWDLAQSLEFSRNLDGGTPNFAAAPNLPPLPADRWRINLYRIDQHQGQEELSAWSPTGISTFHVPPQFGELIFGRSIHALFSINP